MLTALIAALAIVALVVQNFLASRRLDRLAASERMRQDLLLNRLASRNLGEFTAASQAQGISVVTVPDAPERTEPVRYLYDETGLFQVPAPADLNDAAYEEAGSM